MLSNKEKMILEEINAHVPSDIDWKQGAIDYLKQLVQAEGSHNHLYSLIKPFLGGPDFSSFFNEMYGFLNILQKIQLPMKSTILDVACGPGWTSHYLAKLGYSVYGIDISENLLTLARQRVEAEAFSVYEGVPLQAYFMLHDIESEPLKMDVLFDAAFFESALHHFYNPISVLKHVAQVLKEDGYLCVWEGVAPPVNSPSHQGNLELMKKYHTLERPYTRKQMVELLELTGFKQYEFFAQINGLYNKNNPMDYVRLNNQLGEEKNWNIFIAAKTILPYRTDEEVRNTTAQAVLLKNPPGTELNKNIISHVADTNDMNRLMFLSNSYRELLDREPDEEGLRFYLRLLQDGVAEDEVIAAIKQSTEYKSLTNCSSAKTKSDR